MLNLPGAFLGLANMAASMMGAPFYGGAIVSQATPGGYDDDGVFVPGTPPTERPCKVQIDALDERMRPDGWTDDDRRFIVLAASFSGGLDTDASITVAPGPFAGTWAVSSLEMDPAAIGWVGKGRRT